jgi:hypothetical protein
MTMDHGIVGDRIKDFRRVSVSDLIPNPKNWRTHPPSQQTAMAGLLEEIGYADALIAYETDEGLVLIDGHLRAETTPDAIVPVLVLDVTEEEADLILTTLDPISVMAGSDQSILVNLLDNIESDDSRVSQLLENIRNGITPGFEPLGDWEPQFDAVNSINETDQGITSKIIVECPADRKSEIVDMLDEIFIDMPDIEIA